MEKLSPNRAQLFVRNKYTVFTMGGTVALRSVNKIFPESYSSAATKVGEKIFMARFFLKSEEFKHVYCNISIPILS